MYINHDKLNRIKTVKERSNYFDREYTYDTLGNLIKETNIREKSRTTTVYSIDGLNRVVGKQVENSIGALKGSLRPNKITKTEYEYIYDKRGNLIEELNKQTQTKQSYKYDETNRMVKAINHENESSIYNFNGLGVLTSNIQPVYGILQLID